MGTDVKWLIGIGGLVAVLLLTVTVLLLTDPREGPEDAATTTATTAIAGGGTEVTEAPTTAPTLAASTTAADTTSAGLVVTGGRCAGTPVVPFPADATDATGQPGSFDGAPEPESIMQADSGWVYRRGGSWYTAISLFPDGLVEAPLPEPSAPGFVPTVAAVIDFGPATDGVLVHLDRSMASGTDLYNVYYLADDCTVAVAAVPGEATLDLLHGFGAAHREGFRCVSDGIWVTSAGAGAGTLWDVRSRFFSWDPSGVGFLPGLEDGMEVPPDDPEAIAAGQMDC